MMADDVLGVLGEQGVCKETSDVEVAVMLSACSDSSRELGLELLPMERVAIKGGDFDRYGSFFGYGAGHRDGCRC